MARTLPLEPPKRGNVMDLFRKEVEAAAEFIRSRLDAQPEIGLILGTGLGGVAEAMEKRAVIPYGSIPHFPVSTVQSHEGRLLYGKWGGKVILAMQGRFHLYEGYSPRQISFPIRVLAALGVRKLKSLLIKEERRNARGTGANARVAAGKKPRAQARSGPGGAKKKGSRKKKDR